MFKSILVSTVAATILIAAPASAETGSAYQTGLTTEEIRDIAVGNTTFGTFADRPLSYAVFVAPDGRMIGKLMDGESERIETGTWKIENDRLIGQWDELKDGEANAFAYVQIGQNVHAIRDDGSLDRVQFFVDGDPLGLLAAEEAVDPAAEVRTAVDRWVELWNAGDRSIDAEYFASYSDLFVDGDGYVAIDDFTGEVLTIRSYADYARTWTPVMAAFDSWSIERTSDIDVDLAGDMAITFFEFAGRGLLSDGTAVDGYTYATLVLRKVGSEWRIAHEHLTNSEPPVSE